MDKYFFLPLLLFFSQIAFSQSTELEDSLQLMLNQERYGEITQWMQYVEMDTLSAKSLYFTGVAYFVLEEDGEAVDYLKASIEKDPYFGGAYYYLGLINEYSGQLEKAKQLYRSALAQTPGNALYLEHLGDVLNAQGMSDSAYGMYQRVTAKEQTPARIYMKIAEIFLARGADEKALETYYDCLYDAESNSPYYNDCMYNIGHFEYEMGNYNDAAMVLETLHDRNPGDYGVVEKMIQAYVKMENFNKVNDYRSHLYEAHRQEVLPDEMSERFLLDEFEAAGYDVLAYEYFRDPKEPGDIKYAFLVLDGGDSVTTELVLEYNSYALSQGEKYVVTENREKEKFLYPKALFGERINFQELRKTIDKILEGELEPAEK